MQALETGKLPVPLLSSLLSRIDASDPRVVLGPEVGEDAAVLDMGDRYLIAASDPVTFASDEIGWYVVNVNANDVAACGARPRWFLLTLLLPLGTVPAQVERIFEQVNAACAQLGVALIGGHTEVTHDLARPIAVGQMLGEVAKDALVRTAGARVGDAVLLTKGFPLEGTALLAREMHEELEGVVQADDLCACRALLHAPGISVVEDALIATGAGTVHAMHDPTEGGIANGLWELARAGGVGLRIDTGALPVLPASRRICDHFRIDPLGLIASGALLLSVVRPDADPIIAALARHGIEGFVIGEVVPQTQGVMLQGDGRERELPGFERDELARVLGSREEAPGG